MPLPTASEVGRRLLVAAGTAHFDYLDGADLPSASDEMETIHLVLAALGYQRMEPTLSFNPSSTQLRDLFTNIKAQSQPADVIVAYYTSHGTRDPERFYMLTRNSVITRLDDTAVAAEDLARALIKHSKASQILLIVDACYAGTGAAEFLAVANDLTSQNNDGPATFVIAAARAKQEAEPGVFASALSHALKNSDRRIGGRTQPYLAFDDVMEGVDSYLRDGHPSQIATWSSANVRGRCRLFPNSQYRTEIRPGLDIATQRAFLDHWIPKARGVELGTEGWYFTGRDQVLRDLSTWLSADRSDRRPRVVTGGPGTGKSAVLARIVTLSDPTYRASILSSTHAARGEARWLPPEGVVDVAVHARHKLLPEIVSAIAAGLGIVAHDPVELISAIESGSSEKAVIVIDALDEADETDEILSRLLRPLGRLPQVFLLLGTRPDSLASTRRFGSLGPAIVEIDLNEACNAGSDDVSRYVERRLLATEEPGRETPYRAVPEVARAVSIAVADRAKNVFLVAHTAVQALLADDSVIDTNEAGWVDSLPTGLDGAFTRFLAQLDRRELSDLGSAKVVSVLLPLAFAEGEGLPWVDIWAATASSISGAAISDQDISNVQKHASAFIVEATEQGRSVYRLYHESLAEHLRRSIGSEQGAHRRIVRILRSRVPTSSSGAPDWKRAHPYILTHLAAHGLKAEMLGEIVQQGSFLAFADPPRALQALSLASDPRSVSANACFSLAFDRLKDESPDVRLAYLHTTAVQEGEEELTKIWGGSEFSRRWDALWAWWQTAIPHRAIDMGESIGSISFHLLDGRPLALSSGKMLRTWDLSSGTQRGAPLGPIQWDRVGGGAHATGDIDGVQVVVAQQSDGALQVWDLVSGVPRGKALEGHAKPVNAIALGTDNGRHFVASTSGSVIRTWDLTSGRSWEADAFPFIESEKRSWKHELTSVAATKIAEQAVIVAAGTDGLIRIWAALSGAPFCEPFRCDENEIFSLTIGNIDGDQVIIAGGADGICIWNLDTLGLRLRMGKPDFPWANWIFSTTAGVLHDRPVIVSGRSNGLISIWDSNTGVSLDEFAAHEGRVSAIALGLMNGRSVIISGGEDGRIRVWDPSSKNSRKISEHPASQTRALAVGELSGRAVLVSGGVDSAVRVWDLAHGTACVEPLKRHHTIISSVAIDTIGGRTIVVAGAREKTIWGWDLNSGRTFGVARRGHRKYGIGAVALVASQDDDPILVSRGTRGIFRVWNLSDMTQRQPLSESVGYASCFAVGRLSSTPTMFVGKWQRLERWNLSSGDKLDDSDEFGLSNSYRRVDQIALGEMDGDPVAIVLNENTIRILDLASGTPRGNPFAVGEVQSIALGILENAPVIVTAGKDWTLSLWSERGDLLERVHIGSSMISVAAGKDGKVALAGPRGILVLQFHGKNPSHHN